MAMVYIPAAMRGLTGGAATVEAAGETLGAVIESLEGAYPGLRERLTDGARLKAGLAAFINGETPVGGLRARVPEGAEVHFAPAIAGGAES